MLLSAVELLPVHSDSIAAGTNNIGDFANHPVAPEQTVSLSTRPVVYPTIVTALFDLHRREPHDERNASDGFVRRTANEYLDLGTKLLEWPSPMVIFADPELVGRIDDTRSRLGYDDITLVRPFPLETSPYHQKHFETVARAFAESRQPRGLSAVKDTPLYLITSWTKVDCIRQVSESNPFNTANVFWMDFGIHHVAQPPMNSERLLHVLGTANDPILTVFQSAEHAALTAKGDPGRWYGELRQHCGGGVWGGSPERMLAFARAFDEELETNCLTTHPSPEESIFLRIYALGLLDSWDTVRTQGHHDMLTIIERRATNALRVCLCMMVKNESRVIRRALDSVAADIDGWCITDTGSTDGTQSIIEEYFQGKKIGGELHGTTFIDFGASRTESIGNALAFARSNAMDYLLLLDADEVIEVRQPDWRTRLHGSPYLLRYDDPLSYRTLYLVPTDVDWHFVGRTHEYLNAEGAIPPRENFDAIVLHDYGDGGSKADKFQRDIALLSRTLEESPGDERAVFYLAESYLNGNIDVERALELYTRRAAMGGFEEEAWYATYRRAQCLERLAGPEDDYWPAIIAYFEAWVRRPWRAEPLTEVTRLAAERSIHILGSVAGEYALAHVIPRRERNNDILFIDTLKHGAVLYDWLSICHYWAGFRERGRVLARKALDEMGPHHRERIEANIRLGESSGNVEAPNTSLLIDAVTRLRVADVPIAANMIAEAARALIPAGHPSEITIDYEQSICGYYAEPYRAKAADLSEKLLRRRDLGNEMRGSLHANRWFHVKPLDEHILDARRIETAHLEIPLGYHPTNPSLCRIDGDIMILMRAVNYRIRGDGTYAIDGHADTRNFIGRLDPSGMVARVREITAPPFDESTFFIRGFEDCRLFNAAGRTWAVANRSHPLDPPRRTIFLLELNDICGENPSIVRAVHLKGPNDEWHQKNWMPVDGAAGITLVYSCDPTVILAPDARDGSCEVVNTWNAPAWFEDFRGGSQLVPMPESYGGGYVTFVHGVLRQFPKRSYFHRIVRFDKDLAITAASRIFVLRERDIEFVSGCITDGSDLLLTWGYNDAEAWLGRIPLSSVDALCSETFS